MFSSAQDTIPVDLTFNLKHFRLMSNAFQKTGIGKSFRAQVLGDSVSINDLRDREAKGKQLAEDQILALRNYDRLRIEELNRQQSEEAYHAKYLELQAMANLSPYQEFIKNLSDRS